jgi:hypothetical protein
VSSNLCTPTAYRSIAMAMAPAMAMAWAATSALKQVGHGVVAAFAQAVPAAVRGGAAPHPRGIPV